jgi:hypothetical protein
MVMFVSDFNVEDFLPSPGDGGDGAFKPGLQGARDRPENRVRSGSAQNLSEKWFSRDLRRVTPAGKLSV